MDHEINRREFLELLASASALATFGTVAETILSNDIPSAFAATLTRGIFDSAAATNWQDAFLSGNGEYAIMVYGNALNETIIFNDHKFEQPNGSLNLHPPVINNLLPEVRSELLAGSYQNAQSTFPNGWDLHWTQPFHPGYEMLLDTTSGGSISGYKRSTNFETGEIAVQWSDGLGNWSRSSFVSRADDVVVQEFTAPSQGTLTFTIQLNQNLPDLPSGMVFTNTVSTDSNNHTFLNLRGQYTSDPTQGGYEGVTWVVRTGGSQSISGTTLTITKATSVLLLTKLDRYANATQWNNKPLQAEVVTLSTSYSTLLSRHVAIHQAIYDRMTINFNASSSDLALDTTDLLNKQISNPGAPNPALLQQMFNAGRYHFISSSGYFPPRLQGIWGGSWEPNWSDDFTTDANINLQIGGTNIGNTSEMTQAYINLILNEIANWQTNATNIYGTRGILAPPRTDGMDGYLFHFYGGFPGEMWTGGADWLLYPLYEYYMVTGNTSFLQNQLWPWLEQLAYFYEDFLTETDSKGNYIFFPSFSPENVSPDSQGAEATINATQDIAAGKHALQTAIAVANTLGVEQGSGKGVERWTALLAKIPPYRVNSDGALAEWVWPSLGDNYNHRHVSHLYPVWPLHEITPESNPTLAAAAAQALARRINNGYAAHGYLHRALSWARLKNGQQVETHLLDILANKFVFRSLMTSHYPNYNTYNADSAHTLPTVMIEMLADSQPASSSQLGITEFLPALPGSLTQGSITGVVGRNRVTVVSLSWNLTNRTVTATLQSAITQQITLINRPGISSITSSASIASSPLGSFARVLSLQAGVNTSVSLTLPAAGTAYYQFINLNSGLTLDISGSSTSNNAKAGQNDWTAATSQQWEQLLNSDGSYKLVNRHSGKVLDSPGSTSTSGTQLDQYTDSNSTNQWWKLVSAGHGYFYLVNERNGLYVDVQGASTATGAAIVETTSSGATSQQWGIVQVVQY